MVLTATAIVALGAGVYSMAHWTEPGDAGRSRVGLRAIRPADSLEVAGARRPVLMADSVTLLVFADTICPDCASSGRALRDLAAWASLQGACVRLASPAMYDRLGVRGTPVVLLLDSSGVIRGRWLGHTPTHLAILNVLGRLQDPSAVAEAGHTESSGLAHANAPTARALR
jgi:hypothetical protein